jgi:hypothetical protein
VLFLGSQDLEISWRLQELGYRLMIGRAVLVHHRDTGASFQSVSKESRDSLLRASDAALLSKLTSYYGDLGDANSTDIWENRIFDHELHGGTERQERAASRFGQLRHPHA